MANTVAVQKLIDNSHKAVFNITITGDGTGEVAAALVVDVSTLTPVPVEVQAEFIGWSLDGFSARLLWKATADLLAAVCSAGYGKQSFKHCGGLRNNAGAGKNGNIVLSTLGLGAGETGNIQLTVIKSRAA